MKDAIKKMIKKYIAERNLQGRFNEGNKDLQKGLAQGVQISKEQEKDIMEFWTPYLNTNLARKTFDIRWFNIYNKTNVFDFDLKYYIPDGYYYCIVDPLFSNMKEAPVLDDKNLYDLYLSGAPLPKTICRKNDDVYLDADYQIISIEKAIELCADQGKVIMKSTVNSMAGSGLKYWDKDKSSIDDLRKLLLDKGSVVVQEVINQHEVLASFCNSCVNTLRLVTLLFDGVVNVVQSVVIMGGKDAKTNHLHSGGIVCGILPSGQLRHTGFDGKLNMYKTHPNGIVFSDVTIPNYDQCVSLVKELAPRFSRVSRLIGWDLTIDSKGQPLIIEPNLYYGGSVQIAAGPVFGDLTKEVLDFVKKETKM